MIAVECCVKTDGFAAMDADELFFINGGSGNSGSGSKRLTCQARQ